MKNVLALIVLSAPLFGMDNLTKAPQSQETFIKGTVMYAHLENAKHIISLRELYEEIMPSSKPTLMLELENKIATAEQEMSKYSQNMVLKSRVIEMHSILSCQVRIIQYYGQMIDEIKKNKPENIKVTTQRKEIQSLKKRFEEQLFSLDDDLDKNTVSALEQQIEFSEKEIERLHGATITIPRCTNRIIAFQENIINYYTWLIDPFSLSKERKKAFINMNQTGSILCGKVGEKEEDYPTIISYGQEGDLTVDNKIWSLKVSLENYEKLSIEELITKNSAENNDTFVLKDFGQKPKNEWGKSAFFYRFESINDSFKFTPDYIKNNMCTVTDDNNYVKRPTTYIMKLTLNDNNK